METTAKESAVLDEEDSLNSIIKTVKTETGDFSSVLSESSSSESESEQENEKKDNESKNVQAQASRKRKRKKSKYNKKNKKNIDVICKTCGKTESIKFRGFRSKRLICNSCFFRHRRLLQSQAELRDVVKQIIEVNDVEKGYELVLQSNILLSNSRLKKTYNKQKFESGEQAATAASQTIVCDSVTSIKN